MDHGELGVDEIQDDGHAGEGWPLLGLGAGLVLFDVVALELARRAWQRGEVMARV